ncbi:hypothetical protein VTH82DRAFT_3825 [Thermothelomyces myriococcoides]
MATEGTPGRKACEGGASAPDNSTRTQLGLGGFGQPPRLLMEVEYRAVPRRVRADAELFGPGRRFRQSRR